MKLFTFACLIVCLFTAVFAQSAPTVRMATDQHVTLTLNGAPNAVVPHWSLVDPAVPLAPDQSPFRVAYIVTLTPSADGQTCLVTPKGLTSISDGLGTWEVQVRAAGRIIGTATLVIAPPGGATGIDAVSGSAVVASGLVR